MTSLATLKEDVLAPNLFRKPRQTSTHPSLLAYRRKRQSLKSLKSPKRPKSGMQKSMRKKAYSDILRGHQ